MYYDENDSFWVEDEDQCFRCRYLRPERLCTMIELLASKIARLETEEYYVADCQFFRENLEIVQ